MEVFIKVMNGLVMTLEEGKIYFCVWLLYYVSNFCRFVNRRCQDIDQVLLHGDPSSSEASTHFYIETTSLGIIR